MRIEAKNLELAYKQAAEKLNCSITELDIKVVQHPSGGLFGLFRKNAIIEVKAENEKNEKYDRSDKKVKNPRKKKNENAETKPHQRAKKSENKEANLAQNSSNSVQNSANSANLANSANSAPQNSQNDKAKNSDEIAQTPKEPKKPRKSEERKPKSQVSDEVLEEIKVKLGELLSASDFAISVVEVKKYDDENVYIKLDGEDAALLIGKEGYRYKALSYMIYNWISIKYNLSIILEISEFLQNQERVLNEYLNSVIEKVKATGKASTKPYDGALVKFAVDRLRAEFPNKYVGVRSARNGKIILINDNNNE